MEVDLEAALESDLDGEAEPQAAILSLTREPPGDRGPSSSSTFASREIEIDVGRARVAVGGVDGREDEVGKGTARSFVVEATQGFVAEGKGMDVEG